MAGTVLELKNILKQEDLAKAIVRQFINFRNQMSVWRAEKVELRDYIFATDTSKTSNRSLPWMNTTTLPKICQIRDNLHANYMSGIFSKDQFFIWEAHSADDAIKSKRLAIETYMSNKVRTSGFRNVISQLLYDYIDYGNCFADVTYVDETRIDPLTQEEIPGYIGPKIIRISPMDIVINPTAAEFDHTPKITRSIVTLGELVQMVDNSPQNEWAGEALSKMKELRKNSISIASEDFEKSSAYSVDGFGNLSEYYQSNFVEILEFEGSIFDAETGVFLDNYVIVIADRQHVLQKRPNPSWSPHGTKVHAGWRLRPDNLLAMGPLDNLVGMQYRIDHLENAKADAIDLNIMPPIKVIGEVEPFIWAPLSQINMDERGDVQPMFPDMSALNLNIDIANLSQTMEEFAGAPRESMGIRTPGEKTAFEVDQLGTAQSRIFQEKLDHFDINVVEKLLNGMLEQARRNMNGKDIVSTMDDDIGVQEFLTITKADITGTGKLRPVGSRHFAAQNQLMQTLGTLANTPLLDIVRPHMSSKALYRLIEDNMGLAKFDLFSDNIAVEEAAETQRLMQQSEEDIAVEAQTPIDEEEEVL